jgi:hypothetical protein
MGFVVILLLAAGMLVFWLGLSTNIKSHAQTAADAAALAGEETLVHELEQPPAVVDGRSIAPHPDPTAISLAAEQYAQHNQGKLVGSAQIIPTDYGWGYDVSVTVASTQHLPHGSVGPGAGATAQARASTDPFASPSPVIQQAQSPSCDASTMNGPRFSGSPPGDDGFFPVKSADYGRGCEPLLAGRLDQLGQQLSIHVVGLEGYAAQQDLASGDSAADAGHECGAASKTLGLTHVSDARLQQAGLIRVPGEPEEIELSGAPACLAPTQTQTATDTTLGNPSVHLVSLDGGPEGSLPTVGSIGGGSTSLNESQLQVGCQIYSVWQQLGIPIKGLQVALDVAQDESGFGSDTGGNTTDPKDSVGVFQQISADGWGTIAEELDPTTAAEMFFDGDGGTMGLVDYLPQYSGEPVWWLAQETQRSGAGDPMGPTQGLKNYGSQTNTVAWEAMFQKVTSGACKNQ